MYGYVYMGMYGYMGVPISNYIAKNCAFQCTYILILKMVIIKSGKCIKEWMEQERQIVDAG